MTAGLWNNLGNKFTNAGSALANALFGTQNITPIQQNQTKYPEGLQNYLDSLDQKPYMQKLLNQPKETGLTLDQIKEGIAQGLNFGVPEIADAQEALKINKPKTGEEIELAKTGQFNTYSQPLSAGLSATNRQGGLFNDITTGFRENYHNSFDPSNLAPQNKNFATRLGEGLGTVARFADSPLGRGLLAYGLNNALGYDDSGLEGIKAFVGRQNARTADEIYRNNLNKLGIDTSNIKGNVTSDVYKNLADFSYKQQSLQAKKDIAEAKDNVSRARMIMTALNNGTITPQEAQLQMANYGVTLNDLQESNQTKLLPYKQYAMQVAPQVALGNLGVAQGNLALRQAELPYDIAYKQAQLQKLSQPDFGRGLTTGAAENLSGTYQGIGQMKDLKDVINKLPGRITTPGIAQAAALNPLDTDAQAFNQYVKTYKQVIGKGLEGGVLRKEDEYKYDQIIPKMGDTKAVLMKKANQLQNMLESKYNTDLDFYAKSGYNVNNFPKVNTQTKNNTSTGTTSSGVKYKVVE